MYIRHYLGMDFEEKFRDIASRLSMDMPEATWSSEVFVLKEDKIEINLPAEIRVLISKIFLDLAEVLEERDPVTDVLFKNPYDQTEDQVAWEMLAAETLRAERVERAKRASWQSSEGAMHYNDTQNWLRVSNDVRLVLCGTDPTEERVNRLNHGSDPVCVVYQLMTGLVAELVSVW
jgi:hypothetical protein